MLALEHKLYKEECHIPEPKAWAHLSPKACQEALSPFTCPPPTCGRRGPLRLRDGAQASLTRNQRLQPASSPPSWRGSRNRSKEGGKEVGPPALGQRPCWACRSSGPFSLLGRSTAPGLQLQIWPVALSKTRAVLTAKPKSRKVSRPLRAELCTVQPGLTLTDGVRRRGRDAGKEPFITSGLAHDQGSQRISVCHYYNPT